MAIIDKPSDYFNTKLYTGTGSSNAVTGVGFQPDFIWGKSRDTADSHFLVDVIRGATKHVRSDSDGAQFTRAQDVKTIDSDGFTVGTDDLVNKNTTTFVSWNWLGSNTTASNGNGSITSTVSVNATSGFSVVKWTGSGANATIGHGLGATPSMLLVKNATATGGWRVWHQDLTSTQTLQLNTTAAVNTSAGQFNSSATFNSTVFSVGGEGDTNQSSQTIISYSFAEKPFFSKMSSYTGNGNANGPFVYTGFKPAFIIRKNINAADEWTLIDSTRSPFNPTNETLVPNSTAAGSTDWDTDILSNGFKPRTVESAHNGNGNTIIYMAFAENPFVTSTGNGSIPATAR